jgi:histidinol-phosphate aminotransferase
MTSRREFLGSAGAGAATVALRPLFSRNYLFGSSPLATEDFVHINFNESPYGPSEKVLKAIREGVSVSSRYPDVSYGDLRADLAKQYGVATENIIAGAGSTEILKLCDDIFLGPKPRLVAAEPVYDAVIHYAVNSRAAVVKVPLTRDYRHDVAKMADAATPQTGMIYISNPSNPTGTIVTKDELQRLLDRVPDSIPVVLDEAYSHFAGSGFESAINYVKQGRNVIVVKTFSKAYGLAGMRIGYAIARKDLIDKMRPSGLDFAITALSSSAARVALTDTPHVERAVNLNDAQRQSLYSELKAAKFEYIPSYSNFVMINVRQPVGPIISEFRKRKILVGREFPSLTNFMRVSMGTDEEMKRFWTAFRQIFRA